MSENISYTLLRDQQVESEGANFFLVAKNRICYFVNFSLQRRYRRTANTTRLKPLGHVRVFLKEI